MKLLHNPPANPTAYELYPSDIVRPFPSRLKHDRPLLSPWRPQPTWRTAKAQAIASYSLRHFIAPDDAK
jgi:hypothetical protein